MGPWLYFLAARLPAAGRWCHRRHSSVHHFRQQRL